MKNQEDEFWKQVYQKRNWFFLWWIGWLPFGLIGLTILGSIFKQGSIFYIFILLTIWWLGWNLVERQLKSLLCPRCGKPAIGNAGFFMKDAQCQHCGLAYKDFNLNQ